MSSLVILAAAVFEILCEKQTERQTYRQTNADEYATPAIAVGVANDRPTV